MLQPVKYRFIQRFNLPAHKAYEWCTDFTPKDPALMREDATREVKPITENTFILTDKFQIGGETTIKQKLVCLYPNRLMWTSTHLKGAAKHSQFIYEIKSVTKTTSNLKFTALHLAHDLKGGPFKITTERLAEELRKAVEKETKETRVNGKSAAITISIGVSSYEEIGMIRLEEVVNEADEALYKAKELGRNKVMGPDLSVKN